MPVCKGIKCVRHDGDNDQKEQRTHILEVLDRDKKILEGLKTIFVL